MMVKAHDLIDQNLQDVNDDGVDRRGFPNQERAKNVNPERKQT